MNRYLFFINQLYAFPILRPLQQAIRRRGGECAWFAWGVDPGHLDRDEVTLETVTQVKDYDPAAVFVPGNWVPDFFPGLKVQVFHGLANDYTGKKGHFRIRGLFDLYCTHAEMNTRVFSDLAQRHGTFGVVETGWPKLDPLFRKGEVMDLRESLKATKPIVLYASTFSPSLTSAPALIETIRRLSKSGRWHWLVTLHPKTLPAVVQQYRELSGPHLSFFESSQDVLPLLKTADAMLCDTSSICLEFMMLDKAVATFRTKVPGPHVVDATEVDAVEQALERALERPPELLQAVREYVDALHPYRDGMSSERVLRATDEFVSVSAEKLKSKPLNLWRKLQMRRWMRYYHLH